MERLLEPNIEHPIKIPIWELPIEYIDKHYWRVESNYCYKNWKIIKIKDKTKKSVSTIN